MQGKKTFLSLPDWLSDILADSFKKYLCLLLICAGIYQVFITDSRDREIQDGNFTENQIHFFFHPNCPHCRAQEKFNQYLSSKYPNLTIIAHDTSVPTEANLLPLLAEKKGIPKDRLSVPATFIGPYIIIGFDEPTTSGVTLEKAITAYLNNDPSLFNQEDQRWLAEEVVDLPWFGSLQISKFSLPILAAIIGLADGFNPCAMWVLVYLISLIISIRERNKIWLLVGSFVLASGILYFLFMTAWLNVFLLIGYIRPLTIIIGLFALGTGIISIREYIIAGGIPSCKIGDAKSKKRTMDKIETIVRKPLSVSTISGIIALAFIVNSIEFACSAALPAIYTHVLSLHNLPSWQYYSYILLYDFFFMLDDLIIFSLAAFAVNSNTGRKYAHHCTILGGVVLVVLGILMAFLPDLLR